MSTRPETEFVHPSTFLPQPRPGSMIAVEPPPPAGFVWSSVQDNFMESLSQNGGEVSGDAADVAVVMHTMPAVIGGNAAVSEHSSSLGNNGAIDAIFSFED